MSGMAGVGCRRGPDHSAGTASTAGATLEPDQFQSTSQLNVTFLRAVRLRRAVRCQVGDVQRLELGDAEVDGSGRPWYRLVLARRASTPVIPR
jgi:hypothetical protein